ncbi:unnamed protein product [Rotaria sordida]|uniref:Uncharacterized protein n=2 Tax=Rotaria sordida TaxID=392033 RepID=A0A819FGS7_9BILA|nr:unnamed protein product [Rotaria sordida]
MYTSNNQQTLKTRIQDAQGCWHELISPTQRRRISRQQQKINNNNNNNNTNHMEQDIILTNGDNYDSEGKKQVRIQTCSENNNNQQEIRLGNKRKHQELNKDDINFNRSFSQLSISQRNSKKKKTTTTTTRNNQSNNELSNIVSDNNKQQNKKEEEEDEENNESLLNNYIQRFKPQYLKVPDQIFERMSSNAILNGDKIVQCLDTNEKLHFVRQMAEVTNHLQYIDLQRHLWQDYFNLNTIEKRQKTIQHQLKRTINELQQYLIKLEQNAQRCQPSFDSNILSHAINECVKKDSNDRHLIIKFYQLQPTEEQIQLAKQIWQTTASILKTKAQEEIIRKRIFLRRLPSAYDKTINRSMDYVQPMLSNQVLDKDRRASLVSSYSKTITQYKFDLMTLNLDTIQNIIRGHQQLLLDLQNKLAPCCSELLIQAIENRRQTMEKHHELYLKHKLHTFFDEAPTTLNK